MSSCACLRLSLPLSSCTLAHADDNGNLGLRIGLGVGGSLAALGALGYAVQWQRKRKQRAEQSFAQIGMRQGGSGAGSGSYTTVDNA